MEAKDIILYHRRYKGTKIVYNSRRNAGMEVRGIVIQINEKDGRVIMRDYDNFPHCVSIISLEELD